MIVDFEAHGKPEPQGSAKAFIPKGWTRPVVTGDNPKVKAWRKVVAQAAQVRIAELGWHLQSLPTGPVAIAVRFDLPRPKSKGVRAAPHVTRPDVDKLARALCDALTGVLYADDGQVVCLTATKRYASFGSEPGAVVSVEIGR